MKNEVVIWPDGKKMVFIPAGKALIGSENGYSEEKPVHSFETKGFYMDETPVTNAEFRRFCDFTGRSYPAAPPWPGYEHYFTDYPDYPVINVSWQGCSDYAAWAKKRLPTEEEWEYAARAGKKGCDYPWGNAPVSDGKKARANFADKCSDTDWRDRFADDRFRYTSPVKSFEKNGYGLYDMSGNVYEYVNDWFFSYADAVKSTAGFNDGWGGSKVCRGGGFLSPAGDLRVSRRRQILGGGENEAVGFRCVSDCKEVPKEACAHCVPVAALPADTSWFGEAAKKDIHPGAGTELCCGMNDAPPETLKKLKKLGFTSVERYVTWRSVENAGRNCWDFSAWDAELSLLKSAGLKWLPFIIAGPAYSLPGWYAQSDEFEGICCAEHGIESKIQSIWDKRFYRYIDRFIKKLSEHYSDHSVFEGLLFGVCGDFGEAIFSVWHGNWPTFSAGTYHAHSGFWCADRYAEADFRECMTKKYKNDISALNYAWGTNFVNFRTVNFPELSLDADRCRTDEYTDEGSFIIKSHADRVRVVDFIDWYRDSMTEYVGFWMKTARKYFKDTKLYLCTGGEAQPCHGSDFAAQSKVCAKYGAGVRITNEDSNYEKNFCVTDWVASACTFYGGDFSFEPAGQVTERGIVARIYNASAAGATGLHFYNGNILGSAERCEIFSRNIPYFTSGAVKREIAAFFPDTAIMFDKSYRAAMYSSFSALRDYTDFSFADDITVADGILKGFKALIITVGGYYRKKTLDKIAAYVRSGGLLVAVGVNELCTVEGNTDYTEILFDESKEKKLGKGRTLLISGSTGLYSDIPDSEMQTRFFDPITAFLRSGSVYVSDGKRDRVYTAEKAEGLLVMNYSEMEITRSFTLRGGVSDEVSIPSAGIKLL